MSVIDRALHVLGNRDLIASGDLVIRDAVERGATVRLSPFGLTILCADVVHLSLAFTIVHYFALL